MDTNFETMEEENQHGGVTTGSEENKPEDSDSKKRRISNTDHRPMEVDQDTSSRKRTYSQRNQGGVVLSTRSRVSVLDKPNEYSASGLKNTLHGNIYQLKLLMLFVKRGLDKGYYFYLGTEMAETEKFDDLVFQYDRNKEDGTGKEIVWTFIQVKHKQDESKKITANHLLNEEDGDFSLKKYFISYRKIKQSSEFNGQNDVLKDFVICTNIDLGDDLQKSFESVVDKDDILDIEVQNNSKEPKRFKIKSGSLIKERLTSIFQDASDLERLAKKLANHVFNDNDKTITLRDKLFKTYHRPLANEVIDINTKKFQIDFINERCTLSEEVKNFRKVLLEKSKLSEDCFKRKLQTKNLKISAMFGNVLKLVEIPEITKIQELAKHIVDLISQKNTDETVSIEQRANIIKENIAKLAGHVFIEIEDDKQKFRQGFLDGDILPGNLNDFREGLKTKLSSTNPRIQFSHLGQYQFNIIIDTCTEEDYEEYKKDKSYFERLYCLPNDEVRIEEIDEFLKKLVFAVNQPNEVELGKIIEAKMGEDKDINLIDCEFAASQFQKDMLDWMKEKGGRFLSHEDGGKFFRKAKQKISKLVLIGPTLEYRAKVEAFGIEFSEKPKELQSFLTTNDKNIFNLISSHKTIFGSIKVYQTLKDASAYQRDDSYIFIRLRSLLRIQDRVIEAFNSEATNNLLVIECKAACGNIQELYNQLSTIIQRSSNKKVILITLRNNALAEKFKDNFYGNNKYIEKEDKKNSLLDLTGRSQQKLLKKGEAMFQGNEMSLDTLLIDEESKPLVDEEVLSKIINNEEIKIGNLLSDLDAIKDYYIPRTFNRQITIKKESLKASIPDLFAISNIEESELTDLVSGKKEDEDSDLDKRIRQFRDNDPDKNNPVRFIVLHNENAQDNFRQLRDDYSNCVIHWLKKEGDSLIWQKSQGTLSNLHKYLEGNGEKKKENEFINKNNNNKAIIISAEPGMGKSTVLSHLAVKIKQSDLSLWIVRINLVDYSTELRIREEENTKFDKAEIIKFLYRTAGFQLFKEKQEETKAEKKKREQVIEAVLNSITMKDGKIGLGNFGEEIKGLNLLEIGLFNVFYNQEKIALLFDGFDEISPYYDEKFVELLKVLKGTKVERVWVTTRPYGILSQLENELSTFSYTLEPLSPQNQKSFLEEFWKRNLELDELDNNRFSIFADELLERFSRSINDQEREFLGVPLQISMLATIFQSTFKEFYDSEGQQLSDKHKKELSKELNLVSLYERFIYKKFYEISFAEKIKNTNIDNPLLRTSIEKLYNMFIENHEKLALYVIFKKDVLGKLLSEQEINNVDSLIETIKIGDEKTGFIDRVIDNSRPTFIHQTYAEYFVSDYLWKKFKSIKFNEFEDRFLKDVIIGNVLEGNKLQICKFFYSIAHRDLKEGINFSQKDSKIVTLLKSLVDTINILYEQYHLCHLERVDFRKSVKLLFSIVESFLLGKKGNDCMYVAINDLIKQKKSLSLLLISAEVGCINFAKIFISTKIYDESDYEESLTGSKWYFSPLWLAAENSHLEMVDCLRNIYNPNWVDKDRQTLVQRIFFRGEFKVLWSCLKLDIIDVKAFEDCNYKRQLPIVVAFHVRAPSDVVKLLIEKTDIDLVNKCIDSEAVYSISIDLLQYDKEVTELAIKKGIDFSKAINLLLFEFNRKSLNTPIAQLRDPQYGKSSFHSDEEFFNLFERIELLLKGGARYNYKDSEYKKTTLQYAEQIHYVHQLLNRVHKLHNQKNVKSSSPLDTILKLIIDSMRRSSNFRGYEIIIDSRQISLYYINYKHKSFSLSSLENNEKMYLLSVDMATELFGSYEYNNINTNLVKNTLDKLRSYIRNAKEEIEQFKKYPDSKIYLDIFMGYQEMFDYCTFTNKEQKKLRYESLNEFVKDLLGRVFRLYIRQDYEIDNALEEVSEEVSKFGKVINRMLEKKKKGREKNVYNTDEILDIFDIKSIDTNKELQDLITKIYECDGIQLLTKAWSNLNYIGQKRIMGILELMFKFSDQSSKTFQLLKKLDSSYNKLTYAIKNKNYQEINNILQNVDPDFIKAIINGQDDKYGSPLHYAACEGDVETTRILLTNGANPNCRLRESDELLLSTVNPAEETEEDEDWSPENDRGWTPLRLAALNGHKEVIQMLIRSGAEVDATTDKSWTPSQLELYNDCLENVEV